MNIEHWFIANELISQIVYQKRYWIIPLLVVVLVTVGYVGYTLSEQHTPNTAHEEQSIEVINL